MLLVYYKQTLKSHKCCFLIPVIVDATIFANHAKPR